MPDDDLATETDAARDVGRLPADVEGFFDLSVDLLCVAGVDGRFRRVNRAFTDALGWTEAELLARPYLAIVHPDDRAATAAALARLVAGRPTRGFENRLLGKDGAVRWVAWISYQSPEEGLIYSIARDVTERRAAEAALRESEDRYRTLIEVALQVVWMARPDGSVTYVNQQWIDLTGLSLAESERDGWLAAIAPHHREDMRSAWQRAAAAGREWQTEVPFRRVVDGTDRWHLVRGVPVRGETGAIAGWTGVALDIHDRKLAEEAARERAALLDQAYDAIFAWEWEGPIVSWNKGAERLYGYTAPEAIGRVSHDLLRSVHPETVRLLMERLAADGYWEGEIAHTARDGRSITVESRHQAVAIGGRRLVLESNRDVTARKAAEREREFFLHAVTHDLKNPVAAIRMHAQLVRRRSRRGRLDPEAIDGAMGSIEAAGERLAKRLDELVDAAKAGAGDAVAMTPSGADLIAIVRRVLEQHRTLAERHELTVRTDLERLDGPWDPLRIERVVDNLVANAVKYSPDGGPVTVEVERAAADGRAAALLRVRDEGLGIREDDLGRVFEPFRRGANVAGIAGSGIGLASVAQVVEAYRGTVRVASVVGRGSTFTVSLPLDEPEH